MCYTNYDAVGNQTHRRYVGGGSTHYTDTLHYDGENRLTQINFGDTFAPPASYAYDGDGNRVRATIDGLTTLYPNAFIEYRVNNNTLVKYYHADGQRIAMRQGSSTLYYFVSDHLGSTALTLKQDGTVHSETRYKPFGETAWSSAAPPTRRRYTGQIQDFDTTHMQIYFYNARYYDPALARFTQADTLVPQPGNPQSFNRYSYVLNNPLKYTDPTGHYACSSHEKDAADNNFCYGVEIVPGFSEAEIALIILALHEYAAFLGGEQAFFDNITASLDKIRKDFTLKNNAFYNWEDRDIRIGINYIHPLIENVDGKRHVGTVITMSEEYNGHPAANFSLKDNFRFVLAHEMTHALVQTSMRPGNTEFLPDFEGEFYENGKPDHVNALTLKNDNRPRSPEELLGDAIAAYIYEANGLSNKEYNDWIKYYLLGRVR